ncbi:thioredoxin-disulfide reductase [Clostridium sp. DJ247]|uniref:thioredoxin-disulfide reductase n=1 Tax=Clostridium sp. DJ247 TaxID=2726188 RepID=UPI001629ACD4|nr:thioredoxin-disulfide reductase [Clostridium sp. DJ247]MBC2582070.1 thioredoxin-disulfide reductase [Clostridium sp. DJ247]
MPNIYDTIIIGGGPAGLSAALYAGRSKMNTLIIEKAKYGGQVTTTEEIENYPGSIEGATGESLSERMRKQAQDFGTKFVSDEIIDVDLSGNTKVIKGKSETYNAKTIIIATGANPRLAGFKKEQELRARGVSYCATCDAAFFSGLNVAVIGGGDSAITEAIFLTRFAEKIYVIHRRGELRAAKYLQERAFANPKISFIWNTVVEEAIADGILERLKLKNRETGETSEIDVNGCFVSVGYEPITGIFKGKLEMDTEGYIITDEDMQTSVPGIFAAGDVRRKKLRQIITAAADGAVAATIAEEYIANQE